MDLQRGGGYVFMKYEQQCLDTEYQALRYMGRHGHALRHWCCVCWWLSSTLIHGSFRLLMYIQSRRVGTNVVVSMSTTACNLSLTLEPPRESEHTDVFEDHFRGGECWFGASGIRYNTPGLSLTFGQCSTYSGKSKLNN